MYKTDSHFVVNSSTKPHRPKWTFAGRHGSSGKSFTPGPGQYDLNSMLGEKGARIGTGVRVGDKSMEGPCPGTYESTSLSHYRPKSPAWSMRAKYQNKERNLNPAPGTYSLGTTLASNAPKYSMSSRHHLTDRNLDLPGPGTYNASDLHNIPGTKMVPGKNGKSDHHNNFPGPGTYNIPGSLQNKNFSFKGNKYERQNQLNDNIYISSDYKYDSLSSIKSGPKWTMTSRWKGQDSGSSRNPGPGTYVVPTDGKYSKPPAYTMRGKYDTEKNRQGPDPGNYNPTLQDKGPKFSFGKGGRSGKSSTSDVPLAKYDLPSYVGKAPGYTMSGRWKKDNLTADVPGPGSYSSRSGLDHRGAGFGSPSNKQYKVDRVPGPGSYDIPSSLQDKNFTIKGGDRFGKSKKDNYDTDLFTFTQFGY